MKYKSRVEQVKQILNNSHPSQTRTVVGWESEKKNDKKREVGEIWTDENGDEWAQKDGYKIKSGKLQFLRDELYPDVCPECKNPMTKRLDMKYYKFHKRCFDCSIMFEHQLRLEGKYEEYERKKLLENAKAWILDAEKDKEGLKEYLLKAEYVNSDGTTEKWHLPESPEKIKEKIDIEFDRFKKKFLEDLEKLENV